MISTLESPSTQSTCEEGGRAIFCDGGQVGSDGSATGAEGTRWSVGEIGIARRTRETGGQQRVATGGRSQSHGQLQLR